MNRWRMLGLSVMALSLLATRPQPSHPLVGRWTIRMPSPLLQNGGVDLVEFDGNMVVTAQEDSLIAMFTRGAPPGTESEPLRFAGLRRQGPVELTAEVEAAVVTSDRQITRETTRQVLRLDVRGDSLTGELLRVVGDKVANPQLLLRGRRVTP